MPSEWQPIETAPKDGTILRVKNDEWEQYGWQSIMNARWNNGWERVPHVWTLNVRRDIPDPTHWMPLPERPILGDAE